MPPFDSTTPDNNSQRRLDRAEAQIDELRQQLAALSRRAEADEHRHEFLALTACDHERSPSYPAPPANTFRIAFVDAEFDPTPGQRAALTIKRHRPTQSWSATARNIRGTWIAEGTAVVAHWQRGRGDRGRGEWWIDHPGVTRVVATLSKPLEGGDTTAWLHPHSVFDLDSGLALPVIANARNDVLHWNAQSGDAVILGWSAVLREFFVLQPRQHTVCMIYDIDEFPAADLATIGASEASGSAPSGLDCSTQPGCLGKVPLAISAAFARPPTKGCTIMEFADCDATDESEHCGCDLRYDGFAQDGAACCGEQEVGSGSEHSGSQGSCETGDLTGEI